MEWANRLGLYPQVQSDRIEMRPFLGRAFLQARAVNKTTISWRQHLLRTRVPTAMLEYLL